MDNYTIIGGDEKEYGPVSAEDIGAWIREGRADGNTRVRKNSGNWGTLGDHAEFAALIGGAAAGQTHQSPASRMEKALGRNTPAVANKQPDTANTPVQNILGPLVGATGWMKFLAVIMFIYAGVNILSIWGILICWIPIWMGLLLMRSANLIRAAMADGSVATAAAATAQLRTFFVLLGVLMLLTFVATAFMLLVLVAFGLGMS